MKKPANKLALKTDKIVNLSKSQTMQLMGGRPTTGTCQQFTMSCRC
ncbi:MAG: class I lanthipeptide [Spirosomataceae bacterium]